MALLSCLARWGRWPAPRRGAGRQLPLGVDSYESPDAQALLRAAEQRPGRRLERQRELITHSLGAVGFLAAASLLATLSRWERPLSVPSLLVVLVVYVASEGVKFPVAGGWTAPTMLAFVPMLFVLPTPIVPLVAMSAILLARLADFARGRSQLGWVPAYVGDAWFAIGPAVVIVLGGAQRFAWSRWPIYLCALFAQVAFDMAATIGRYSITERISPRLQLPLLTWIYAVDAMLAPLGLLVAASATTRPELALISLSPIAMLIFFARERRERLDQALTLSDAYKGTALLLADVVEADDAYTGMHSRSVVRLSLAVGEALGLNPSQHRQLEFGALLHDVGKLRIPNQIIGKRGPLDDAEWAILHRHTIEGEAMLRRVGGLLSEVGRLVRATHERYDGRGYPDGLVGEAIPIEARIISACDAYSAMTTNRSYRLALGEHEALAELEQCAGSQFDPSVVAALCKLVRAELALSAEQAVSRLRSANGGYRLGATQAQQLQAHLARIRKQAARV